MCNIRFRTKLIILIFPLLFSIFLVTHYHFCNNYSKKCLICYSVNNRHVAYIPPLSPAEGIQPLFITLYIISFVKCIPGLDLISTSYRGRAPPFYS
jgi:hypothetical protein